VQKRDIQIQKGKITGKKYMGIIITYMGNQSMKTHHKNQSIESGLKIGR
jgi:hypothetical protein